MKKAILPILILIAAAAVIMLSTNSDDATDSNVQRYESDELGIAVEYPDDYSYTSDDLGFIIFAPTVITEASDETLNLSFEEAEARGLPTRYNTFVISSSENITNQTIDDLKDPERRGICSFNSQPLKNEIADIEIDGQKGVMITTEYPPVGPEAQPPGLSHTVYGTEIVIIDERDNRYKQAVACRHIDSTESIESVQQFIDSFTIRDSS